MSVPEFKYVVERKEPDRICFGSGQERKMYDKVRKGDSPGPYNLEKSSAFYNTLNKVNIFEFNFFTEFIYFCIVDQTFPSLLYSELLTKY